MQRIKLYWLALLAFALAVAIFASGILAFQKAHAGGTRLTQCDNVTGMGGSSLNATTTPVYLPVGTLTASSTMGPCNTQNANAFAVNIYANASTTGSIILWVVQGSMNGVDWYNLDRDEALSAGVVTHQGTTTDTWTPGVASRSAMNYVYPTFGATYARLVYSGAVASSSVYINLVPINTIVN